MCIVLWFGHNYMISGEKQNTNIINSHNIKKNRDIFFGVAYNTFRSQISKRLEWDCKWVYILSKHNSDPNLLARIDPLIAF